MLVSSAMCVCVLHKRDKFLIQMLSVFYRLQEGNEGCPMCGETPVQYTVLSDLASISTNE
jgi:hypothetical protein